jgi:hypothetical protein
MNAMRTDVRVCPFCGEPPGDGVFCAACGRNLAAVEQLPTRADWTAGAGRVGAPPAFASGAEATGAFLAAMRAAGDPGMTETPVEGSSGLLRRAARLEGWVVRPVERNDEDLKDGHYVPGLVLTPAGHYHRLDNKVRGWGTRDFPRFEHSVSAEPVDAPDDARLAGELAAVLEANGLATA